MQYQIRRKNNKNLSSVCNRYIAIQEVNPRASDGQGGFTEVWTIVTGLESIPAAIWPLSALKKAEYRTYNVYATHHIKIRSNIDIKEDGTNRILYWDRIFNILSIENIQEADIETLIVCQELRP